MTTEIQFEVTNDSKIDTGSRTGTILLSIDEAKKHCVLFSGEICASLGDIGRCDLNKNGKCRKGGPLIASSRVKGNPKFVPNNN